MLLPSVDYFRAIHNAAGLKHAKERTLKIGVFAQAFQHTKQYGGMAVVTTSVHIALGLRSKLRTRQLTYRQCIYIGTQHHTSLQITSATLDTSQDARRGYRLVLDAQSRKLLGDKLGSTMLFER